MLDRKYICAYTALGCNYPEYMNIYQYGDEIEVTIRPPAQDGVEGKTVSLRFPKVLFDLMLEDLKKNYKPNG